MQFSLQRDRLPTSGSTISQGYTRYSASQFAAWNQDKRRDTDKTIRRLPSREKAREYLLTGIHELRHESLAALTEILPLGRTNLWILTTVHDLLGLLRVREESVLDTSRCLRRLRQGTTFVLANVHGDVARISFVTSVDRPRNLMQINHATTELWGSRSVITIENRSILSTDSLNAVTSSQHHGFDYFKLFEYFLICIMSQKNFS